MNLAAELSALFGDKIVAADEGNLIVVLSAERLHANLTRSAAGATSVADDTASTGGPGLPDADAE
jgi:hypothetical protein